MWPFRKKPRPTAEPMQIRFSQLDITARFGDDERLGPDDWLETEPLNLEVADPESMGLPSTHAAAADVYGLAQRLSPLRESGALPNDGVYCPICHIAGKGLARLRTPCPRCSRPLLQFGWD